MTVVVATGYRSRRRAEEQFLLLLPDDRTGVSRVTSLCLPQNTTVTGGLAHVSGCFSTCRLCDVFFCRRLGPIVTFPKYPATVMIGCRSLTCHTDCAAQQRRPEWSGKYVSASYTWFVSDDFVVRQVFLCREMNEHNGDTGPSALSGLLSEAVAAGLGPPYSSLLWRRA
jgi:hypothetical protein